MIPDWILAKSQTPGRSENKTPRLTRNDRIDQFRINIGAAQALPQAVDPIITDCSSNKKMEF
jgi:hypothetical protein